MPNIFAADADDHACPYRDFQPCLGVKCMAWRWNDPPFQRCETDNLQDTPDGPRPVGDPPTPEGEGWLMEGPSHQKGYHRSEKDKLPKATAQRWLREMPKVRGGCARHPGDNNDRYGGDGMPW